MMRPFVCAKLVCGALVAWLSLVAPASAHDDGAVCINNPTPAIVAARALLAKTPNALDNRFKLADVLVEANCYDAAVHVLEEGEPLHPGNAGLQAKLRTTRSLVSEQGYFAGLEQAEVAARVSRNLLRCSRLGDLAACDEALKLKPDDVDILIAKGDAQLKAAKPADAEQTFRRARQLAPDNARAGAQLAAAHTQRAAALANCQAGSDDAALAGCQSALLRGADDEFAIHTRLGQIYQQRNQPAPALTSYIAANALKRGDRNVALGIVALTESDTHRDAVTWAARGAALLTLNRGSEALTALRQAQSLAPGMPELQAQLVQADKLARAEKSRAPQVAAGALVADAGPAVAAAPARHYSNVAEPSRSN